MTEALLRRKKVIGTVKNAVITTSHGETFAIAVKHQRPEEEAEDNAVITVAEIAEVATVEEATEAEIVEEVSNVETIVAAEIVVVEDSSSVTTEAEISEVVTVEEATEAVTTVVHPVENIAEAMIVNPHDETPENLVDGGPKARAALAGAEISRGAFI